MSNAAISVQLYSIRDAIAADLGGALDRVAEIGFTNVEPYGVVDLADRYAVELPARGLSAPSAHASFLENGSVETALEAAAKVGVTTLIDPFIAPENWSTAADVERIAGLLNSAAAKADGSGIAVGYHNHNWELSTRIGDTTALEHLVTLLDPAVVLEVDTYWVEVGGESAVELLGRLGDRVKFIHVKDGSRDGEVTGQLPAGSGQIPVAEILAAAPAPVRVIEFDDYAGDVFDGLAQAFAFVTEQEAGR
ncbi:MAG: sugar phosphate isomerase/epimerase [Naasia sp.]